MRIDPVRRWWRAILCAALVGASTQAHAVILGSPSWLGAHTVQIAGGRARCTGVVISRTAVVTSAHCLGRGAQVLAGGGALPIAGVARNATSDSGVRISVAGDAAILRLAQPLPFSVSAVAVGAGAGDFVIAGYGTTDEAGSAFGALHEARLVPAGARRLVDPNRGGAIGASACFGDSGGPVMRGGMLVGVITRASHPSPRIACGHLTHWAPVVAHGAPTVTAFSGGSQVGAAPDRPRAKLKRKRWKKWKTWRRRS
jgi:hypothetical protein